MHPVIPYVIAALLFGLGVAGVLRRRNAILILMSIELMLNAVNLILITADATLRGAVGERAPTGQVFTLFVIVLAAAEIGVGIAIVLRFFRLRGQINADEIKLASREDDDVRRASPVNSDDAEAAHVA